MRRTVLIILAALMAGVVLVALLTRQRPENARYQGKSIKEWTRQLALLDSQEQQRARDAFRAMGAKAVPGLIRLLQAKDPALRVQAWSLLRKQPRGLRRIILRTVGAPEAAGMRRSAAQALGIIGPPAALAVPALAHALQDPDRNVGWVAAKALAQLGRVAVPALSLALADKDSDVRHEATYALGQIGPDAAPATAALLERLVDSSPMVRSSARYSLSAIGPQTLPLLVHAVERQQGEIQRSAAAVLGDMSAPRRLAEAPLLTMLGDDEPASRQQAIESLSHIQASDEVAITALIARLKDPAPEVRLAAVQALGAVGVKARAAVPALTEMLQGDEDFGLAIREALNKIEPSHNSGSTAQRF